MNLLNRPIYRWGGKAYFDLKRGYSMAKVYAPMAGSVWKIVVSIGDRVEEGEDIVILESMKMEIPITAEQSGRLVTLFVAEGDFVNEGDVLAELE